MTGLFPYKVNKIETTKSAEANKDYNNLFGITYDNTV
jgi:hypothetical protein